MAPGPDPEVVMRLSEWRATAPARDAVADKVAAVIDPVLIGLGADPDPHCWVAWGEEPANRFSIFVPTEPGLIACFVRVNIPGEGPRATTKLVRWNRVSVGELAVETQAGHRMLSFQLETQVLRGVDAEADRAAAFALRVIAAIDGRPLPPVEETRSARLAAGPAGKAAAIRPPKGRAGPSAKVAGSSAKAAGSTARLAGSTARAAGSATSRAKASSNVNR